MRKSNSEKCKRNFRSTSGATLTELLVASVLLGISMAAIGDVMGLMTLMAGRVNNRASVVDSERIVVNRIASDVRSARKFGDGYGKLGERYQFPSSDNPFYGVGKISVNNAPYFLSSHTLILQTPTFYSSPDSSNEKYNIFPMAFRPTDTTTAPISASPPTEKIENRETVIYDVIPSAVAGKWDIVMKKLPGAFITSAPTGLQPTIFRQYIDSPAQVIATGITGPLSRNGETYPVVFQYLRKSSTGKIVRVDPAQLNVPGTVDTILGVGINIEMKKPSSNVQQTTTEQQIGLHSEVFLRTNSGVILKL